MPHSGDRTASSGHKISATNSMFICANQMKMMEDTIDMHELLVVLKDKACNDLLQEITELRTENEKLAFLIDHLDYMHSKMEIIMMKMQIRQAVADVVDELLMEGNTMTFDEIDYTRIAREVISRIANNDPAGGTQERATGVDQGSVADVHVPKSEEVLDPPAIDMHEFLEVSNDELSLDLLEEVRRLRRENMKLNAAYAKSKVVLCELINKTDIMFRGIQGDD